MQKDILYPATGIAKLFVEKSIAEGNPVTNMKLQKIVYFAHGLYLAYTDGKPLIADDVQAWQYGPVIPSVYYKYSIFKNNLIFEPEILKAIGFYDEARPELGKEATEVVDTTWEILSHITAVQLSNWTHEKGSAWYRTYQENAHSITIPNEIILEDFREFVEKPQQ